MQRINHVKEQLILTQGEGDMRFQEFRKWVRNQISEWYDNNEDYKKEIEEAVERLHERFGAEGDYTQPRSRAINNILWELRDLNAEQMFYTMLTYLPTKQANQLLNQLAKGLAEGEIPNRNLRLGAEIYDRQGNLRTVDDSFIEATIDKLQALNRLFEANRKQILATNNQDTKTRLRAERYQIQDVMARLRAFIDDPINHEGGDFMVRLGAEEFGAERYEPTPKEIRMFVRYLRVFWLRYEEGIYDQDEVLEKIEWALYHTGVLQEDEADYEFAAESERTFTVSKGPKRMYIVVEYNDGKELFLDGDGQKYFMEELAEAEATGDEILVEKLFGVGSDYHGIAEEVVEAEEFEATKNCVWCGSTENICCTNEASQNSVKGIKNRFGEEVIESFPMSNPTEEEYVCDECCFICGDKSVLIPNLIESSEMGHPESFEATKGIDTYSQPFEELRIKPSKAKVGILLASIVASGVWFVNKMKED